VIGGELVREARKRSRMTQRELAEKAGTTQSAIARLESCRHDPSLATVQRLMRLCGFDLVIQLVDYDPDAPRPRPVRPEDMEARMERVMDAIRNGAQPGDIVE
jgi:transcriptional regulator with XRE-family HTH domain